MVVRSTRDIRGTELWFAYEQGPVVTSSVHARFVPLVGQSVEEIITTEQWMTISDQCRYSSAADSGSEPSPSKLSLRFMSLTNDRSLLLQTTCLDVNHNASDGPLELPIVVIGQTQYAVL